MQDENSQSLEKTEERARAHKLTRKERSEINSREFQKSGEERLNKLREEKKRKKESKSFISVPSTPEEFVARAEAAIARMIENDHPAAVIFTLKSLGAHKGWIEKNVQEAVDSSKLDTLDKFFKSVHGLSESQSVSKEILPSTPTNKIESISPDLSQENEARRSKNFP